MSSNENYIISYDNHLGNNLCESSRRDSNKKYIAFILAYYLKFLYNLYLSEINLYGGKKRQNRGLLTHHETYDKNEGSIFGCVHNRKREKITLNNKRHFI